MSECEVSSLPVYQETVLTVSTAGSQNNIPLNVARCCKMLFSFISEIYDN